MNKTTRMIGISAMAVGAAVAAIAVAIAMRRPPPAPEAGYITAGPVINAPELRTASTHPMQYYVSLPSGWSKRRTWPVVVSMAGSDKDWLATANVFAAARDAKQYPFIVITPVVLTNGGRNLRAKVQYTYAPAVWDSVDRQGRCAFDQEGVAAVVADVAKEYGGETKVFLTGFSGGGHPAFAYLLIHPERMRGAGLSAANYIGRCVNGPTKPTNPEVPEPVLAPPISNAPERITLPVRLFIGANDPNTATLLPQGDRAISDLKMNLFADVSTTTVPGVRHDPMAAPVLEWFYSLLGPKER